MLIFLQKRFSVLQNLAFKTNQMLPAAAFYQRWISRQFHCSFIFQLLRRKKSSNSFLLMFQFTSFDRNSKAVFDTKLYLLHVATCPYSRERQPCYCSIWASGRLVFLMVTIFVTSPLKKNPSKIILQQFKVWKSGFEELREFKCICASYWKTESRKVLSKLGEICDHSMLN